MKKFLGEKYNKFSLRKLTVGVCSMTIGSFFLVSTVQPEENIVKAADNAIVHYKYVGEDNLTDKEKELIRKEVPSVVNSTEETYYLVFKPNKITQLNKLPNTGLNYGVGSMLLGGMLGLLVVVVAKGKNKSRKILSILLVTSMGATTLELPARAMEDLQLSVYNMDYNLKVGDRLPNISSIPGYSFVGFIKNEAETKKLKEEVKGNVNSQQNNKKQPQLKENTDVNVTDKKQENKATLNNPDTKAYTEEESGAIVEPEKVESPKEYTGVQAGAIVEPEKVEPPKEYTGVQAGAIVEPEKAESPKEYTGVQAGAIVEPEKAESPKEYTGVQAGAIVEPEKVEPPKEYTGVQAGAIVEPEKAESLKEYTGEQAGAIVEPEKAESPKEYTGVQAGAIVEPEKAESLKEYTGEQAGAIVEPEKAESPKEYTGVQAGAIVEPEKVEPQYGGVASGALVEPEKVESPKEYTGVQAGAIVEPEKVEPPKEYTGVQAGAIVEPEKVEPLKEYTGVQSGAIVEPEQVEPSKEYTGVQAGAIVEPEKVEPLKEYTGVQAGATVEPEKAEAPKEYTGVQAGAIVEPAKAEVPKEYTGMQAGAIVESEKVEPSKEYTGVQAGAIVEPEKVEPPKEYTGVQAGAIVEPEKAEAPKEYTGVQAGAIVESEKVESPKEYTGVQAGAIVEPAKVEVPKEYTGMQAGAIVEPEKVEPPKEYTGVQAGAIVEPEKVEPPKEYTGKIEQPSAEKERTVDKKLELRNISNVELYTLENNKYRHVTSLSSVPTTPTDYFMKVKSENFKDVMLPVKSIESARKGNQEVYKIVGQANDLIQHENNSILENYTYYLPKTVNSENGVFTSFKNLVEAMNRNLHGTFRLGATMDAREVELRDGQESYIDKEFSGTLIGANNGKNYAIYNLKKPLFNALSHATIQDLSIKEANVSSKVDTATIAKEAKNGSKIINVHSSGVIAGERSIGGLVSQVTNSEISNSSFTGRITNTYDTNSIYQIGGLVGKLSGASALIDRSISSIDMATNANTGDQVVGGIAGLVDKNATIRNSYVEGNLNNVKHFGYVGGVAGYLWDRDSSDISNSGNLTNVLSDVNVTNGNAIAGYDFNGIKATNTYSNKNNKVVNVVQVDDEVLSRDSEKQRGIVLDNNKVLEKKTELVSKKNTKIEDFNFSSRYVTDYGNVEGADVSRLKVYKNIEKLLPFYNRETIVKYGNLVETNNDLFTKDLVSVVPMKDKEVITDINKNKGSINKLLLHYSDNTSQTLDVKYQQDFSKVAEYEIVNTKLIYTPNTLLHDYNSIVKSVLNDLKSVQYNSDAVRRVLDISSDIKLTELYLDEQFDKTKANIGDTLSKLLSADAAIAENNNSIIDNYVIEKIKNNKEALLLGLAYLERWYNFKYDNASAKDLVMYHLDFFGKSNSSALDNVIELGKSGFNNLLAKNNVITYNVLLAKNYGTESLFKALEGYRKVFLPKTSNNEWFKKQTKAYIVEEKSTIKEVSDKQSIAGSPYSIGVYDRLTSPSWKYQSMVLPLLTLPEKSVFMIANISTIGFGAYDRYRSKEYPKGEKLNKFVEENAQAAAKRFRDHYDYWYKILDNENKEKLFRSIPVYDAFRFGNDEDNKLQEANFETNHPAIKHFFGPAGNNVVHNANGAYATGDAFYYMAYRMLDKSGAVTYTHEMTHNSDREIYLGGYGRRSGLGPEFFAKGLLQAPDHPNDATITINSILKHLKSDSKEGERLQILDPTTRFNSADDLKQYVHNMFDVVYMLEYLEGQSIIQHLSNAEKMTALRKIENVFVKDPDGNNVYATNVVRDLTVEEAKKLRSFNDLIDNNIISSREYASKTYERNGYFTIKLFAPIYAALSNDDGTPGDLMGRRMAYELLAAKGFKDGMVPYISNQFEPDARENNKTISSYGKTKGLVTDKLVLHKLFNGQYHTWSDFKKAMYTERKDKFNKLNKVTFKDTTKSWTSFATKTTSSIDELQKLMNEAVRQDAEGTHWDNYNPETDSAVHKLKRAIFKAYLDQTDDFRSSIFENKK